MNKTLLALGCLLGIGAPAVTIAVSQPAAIIVRAEDSVEQSVEESVEQSVEESVLTEEVIKESKDAWAEFVAQYFTAEKVAMYMSWIAYVGTIIGLAANIVKIKKAGSLTLKNVSEEVQNKLKEVVSAEVAAEVDKFIPAILATQQKTNDVLKIFSKIMALAQENTPESRVAILQLIEELGTIGKEVTDAAKEAVEKEVEAIEDHKEKVGEKLDEIIDSYDGTSI